MNLPVYILEDAAAVAENVKILGREKIIHWCYY
jgi:hypothetical protein